MARPRKPIRFEGQLEPSGRYRGNYDRQGVIVERYRAGGLAPEEVGYFFAEVGANYSGDIQEAIVDVRRSGRADSNVSYFLGRFIGAWAPRTTGTARLEEVLGPRSLPVIGHREQSTLKLDVRVNEGQYGDRDPYKEPLRVALGYVALLQADPSLQVTEHIAATSELRPMGTVGEVLARALAEHPELSDLRPSTPE